MKQEQAKTQSLIKQAAKVFQSCPCCKSPNLIKLESEAICFYCDWNSAAITGELSRGWRSVRPTRTHIPPNYVPNGGILGGKWAAEQNAPEGMSNE